MPVTLFGGKLPVTTAAVCGGKGEGILHGLNVKLLI